LPCWPIRGEEQKRGKGGKDWGPRLKELDNPDEEGEDEGTLPVPLNRKISLVPQLVF
jgi:hypothetical protein